MASDHQQLRTQIEALRKKIRKLQAGRGLNEETTKAALITPLLTALGWDTADPEEVNYEYRRRPKDNPVDFALMLQRTPCLFVEAKPLGQNLDDRRWTNQVISYSTQSGVGWVVLTNGNDYHIYNAHAPVPLEGKLFHRVSITETSGDEAVQTLSLLSKDNFAGKQIDRAWDAHHVDRQVEAAMVSLFSTEECDRLAHLISKMAGEKLSTFDVRASILRANLGVEFPPAPIPPAIDPPRAGSSTLKNLIDQGLLRPPVEITAQYRGHTLTATITADGSIEYDGKSHSSLSTAGGIARKPHYEGNLKGRPYPQTNGWMFWRIKDPKTGDLVELDVLRRRAQGG